MRLSIEVTSDQHNKLKAVAALNGQTIKDYVLDRVLPDTEAAALDQLEGFLKPRIRNVSTSYGQLLKKLSSICLEHNLRQ